MRWQYIFIAVFFLFLPIMYGFSTFDTSDGLAFVFYSSNPGDVSNNGLAFKFDSTVGSVGTTNSTTIVDSCTSINIYHSQNLSCEINASSTEDYISWSVNDSRVEISRNNDSAYLIDDPSLTDYNIGACWSILITANATNTQDTSIIQYCIDDHAPTRNDTALILNNTVINYSGYFFDADNDVVSMSFNCTAISAVYSQSDYSYVLTFNELSPVGNYPCQWNITDNVTTSSNNITVNISSAITFAVGDNLSAFIPQLNLSSATFNATLNTLKAYNTPFQNMSISNPLWNVSSQLAFDDTIGVTRNVTRSDIVVGCSCTYDVSTKINLSGTVTTDMCVIGAGSYVNVWCWTDFVDTNLTNEQNVTFDMNITVI